MMEDFQSSYNVKQVWIILITLVIILIYFSLSQLMISPYMEQMFEKKINWGKNWTRDRSEGEKGAINSLNTDG